MPVLNDFPLGISLILVVLLTVTLAVGFLIFIRVYIRRHFNISDETDDTFSFMPGQSPLFMGLLSPLSPSLIGKITPVQYPSFQPKRLLSAHSTAM